MIGAANRRFAIQVSDRRLSDGKGTIFDDESNKAIIFTFDGGRFIVGYTGLARTRAFSTIQWLGRALRESAPPDYSSLGLVTRLAKRATHDFSSMADVAAVAPAHKRLTILLTGFLRTPVGPRPAQAFISNWQNFETGVDAVEADSAFSFFTIDEKPEWHGPVSTIQRIGAYKALSTGDTDAIRVLLEDDQRPSEAVVGRAVDAIRRAAASPLAKGGIGRQLMSATIYADSDAYHTAYHTDVPSPVMYMPAMVTSFSNGFSFQVDGATMTATKADGGRAMVVFPKQPKNTLCSCGSKKRYRRCHGRKR